MDIKPRPNHARYIESLRRMTPEQRLRKSFELTDYARRLFVAGLRARFPQADEAQIKKMAAEHLLKCHNRNS